MEELKNSDDEYVKFKWEFLRRNKKYINQWEELNRKFNTTNGKPTKKGRFDAFFDKDGFVSDEALKKLLGKHCIDPRSGEEVVEFCKQWNISVAVQPDFSYKELHEVIASIFTENFNDVNIVGITAPTEATIRGMISHPTLKKPIKIEDGYLKKTISADGRWFYRDYSEFFYKEGLLNMTINLNYSKYKILENFEKTINEYRKLFENANVNYTRYLAFKIGKKLGLTEKVKKGIKEDGSIHLKTTAKDLAELDKLEDSGELDELFEMHRNHPKKYHFKNFPLYLKVYDFRKSGLSWSSQGTVPRHRL